MPGHGPSAGGIPPVSLPCTPRQVAQLVQTAYAAEQEMCERVKAAMTECAYPQFWQAQAREQEDRRRQLEKIADDITKAWPAFRSRYVAQCRTALAGRCSAEMAETILDVLALIPPSIGPRNYVQAAQDLAKIVDGSLRTGVCSAELFGSVVSQFTDKVADPCENAAAQIHSRILNGVIAEKNDAEDRRERYLDFAMSNPECACESTSKSPSLPLQSEEDEVDEDIRNDAPPSS